MKVNGNQNLSFKGFSNIISNNSQFFDQKYMFMAMRLDNTCGYPDLDNFRRLCHDISYLPAKDGDVLTITYKKDAGKEELFMNTYQLYPDEVLTNLKNKFHYDKLIEAQIKAYTFLANITKRIANTGLITQDTMGLISIAQHYIEEQNIKFANNTYKFDFIDYTINNKSAPAQNIAEKFNRCIHHTMKRFFR